MHNTVIRQHLDCFCPCHVYRFVTAVIRSATAEKKNLKLLLYFVITIVCNAVKAGSA
jgi:hypothetical protein